MSDIINLNLIGSSDNNIVVKVKKDLPFTKVIEAWCSNMNISPASVRFLFDGQRINPTQTPEDFEMVDGDNIDVLVEQTGGFYEFASLL